MRQKAEISTTLPPLSQSEITALSALANEGPTNTYQIMKKTGKGYSLMFKAIKNLENRALVSLVEKKQTQKGTTANIYNLTFMGILTILSRELSSKDAEQWNYDQIRKIIKKYDNWIPIVFAKWSFFQKMGVEKIALFRLKVIIENMNIERVHILDLIGYGGRLVPHADIKTVVVWLFFLIGLIPTADRFEENWQIRKDAEVWVETLKQDKEIVIYLLKELEYYKQILRSLNDFGERLRIRIVGTNKQKKNEKKSPRKEKSTPEQKDEPSFLDLIYGSG